ncbi:MAG: hypothetical protein R3B09_00275 [Nannocystaceae bacterium]
MRSFMAVSLATLLTACPPSEGVTSTDATATGTSNVSTTTSLEPKTTGPEDPSSTTDETDTTTGDGATSSSTTDTPPICGDGDIDPGEECDDGEANDNEGACTEQCTAAVCGDGFEQPGEGCDLGQSNDNEGECTNHCQLPACGDGYIQPGETCDDGEANDADKLGGCHPETCQPVTTCGDGVIQDDEECDPNAEGDVSKICSEQCLIHRKVIFASSVLYAGDLLGLTAADATCKELADAADLENPGAFIAWLSTPSLSMADRIEPSQVKYVRSDGALIADGWADLVDGTILSPINKDELGGDATEMGEMAWTGTKIDGLVDTRHCNSWTSGSFTNEGLTGWLTGADFQWTQLGVLKCNFEAHLYCIET